MNLVGGKILDTKACGPVLETLEGGIEKTLSRGRLDPQRVIHACDRVVASVDTAAYLDIMMGLGIGREMGIRYLEQARRMFSREYLTARIQAELGDIEGPGWFTPPLEEGKVFQQLRPLGVLLHIAAGNADGLPAFSVLEGLLTGNINILKLPGVDGGLSIRLLQELIAVEPMLAEYIYVFDYSSKDMDSMEVLVGLADAVVVWGGDAAVSALRRLASPNTKLIEWGHKVSFGYVSGQPFREEMEGLARHICETNQLLCSSCQGVFVDTEDPAVVHGFCRKFLPLLEQAAGQIPGMGQLGVEAQVALRLYTEELEEPHKGSKVYRGKGCSITAYADSILEPGIQFRNCWVKPLPRKEIVGALRPHKNHLHTVGLLSSGEARVPLAEEFFRTGVVRVVSGEKMSSTYCGGAHDGEYPLRRYMKVVSIE